MRRCERGKKRQTMSVERRARAVRVKKCYYEARFLVKLVMIVYLWGKKERNKRMYAGYRTTLKHKQAVGTMKDIISFPSAVAEHTHTHTHTHTKTKDKLYHPLYVCQRIYHLLTPLSTVSRFSGSSSP